MDAKRIIPLLQVTAPALADSLVQAASRLELAGADELLFQEGPGAGPGRCAWIAAVAGNLFIPFALEADFGNLLEVEQALEAGADKLVLGADPASLELLTRAAGRFGRTRLGVAVTLFRNADRQWRVADPTQPAGRDDLAWLVELGQRGAGELHLRVDPAGLGAGTLFQLAAQLANPVLCRCADAGEAAQEALLHGADGLVLAEAAFSAETKAALGGLGLVLRV